MFSSFSQFTSTAQFFLYGRNNFTRTGWDKAMRNYEKPDILENISLDLTGKVYMITGANSGIGREVATFLAKRNAHVYLICRNRLPGEVTRSSMIRDSEDPQNASSRIHIIVGDCSLESDVRDAWDYFFAAEQARDRSSPPRLDGLICNAGLLLNERTLTNEGVEMMFATHLLFGVYLLGKLALDSGVMPTTSSSRIIVMSSGGIYNTKFPAWDVATSQSRTTPFDGQFVYAYTKRGQVLLCERWAEEYPEVKIVAAHPGWTLTPGLEKSYGESKKHFEPLRTIWQGAEGIIWLAVAPPEKIESGAFYLDRSPQPKHIAGAFFNEGTFTKNTKAEVDEMMAKLEVWSSKQTRELELREIIKKFPLRPRLDLTLDINKMSGRWYVLANIPTTLEIGAINCIEKYQFDAKEEVMLSTFEYQPKDSKKLTTLEMRGKVVNSPLQTHWNMDPKFMGFHVPLALDLLFLEIADDYSYCLACTPDRSALWVMVRDTPSQYSLAGVPINEVYRLDIEDDAEAFPLLNTRTSSSSISTMQTVSEKMLKERKFFREIMRPAMEDLGIDTRKVLRCAWTLWN